VELLLGIILVLGGGVVMTAGVTGSSLASVVKGAPDHARAAAAGTTTTGGASAQQVNTATGVAAAPGAVNAGVASIAKSKGWGASQITAWLGVIARESGGSLTATNPSSGAYGIAQFINGPSEYAVYGGNSTTVPGQLTAMANYIEQRYGTPANALAHENTFGWY